MQTLCVSVGASLGQSNVSLMTQALPRLAPSRTMTVHCVPHCHTLTYARLVQGRCGSAGATVTALVTDVCPECSAASGGQGDHFDLNALSFGELAPDTAGRIDVNYRLVACTPPSDIQVMVDGNAGSGLWLRLVITVSCSC